MVISSLDNEKVKKYRKLQKRKYRDEYNEYIVEGMHLVLEAYKKGAILELILEENEALPIPAPYTYVTQGIINKISTMDTPSTVMALCKKLNNNELLGDRVLILDEIQDPGNLGTIIRSAVAFHVSTVVLSENTVDLYNPKVLRATQGMLFHINIIQRKACEIISILHNMEIPIYGTDVECGIDVKTLSARDKKRFALIVGNEGNGVRIELKKLCDQMLSISMDKNVESLNVAIAASIFLYELN